jgi:uncharacterized repeat protein (TIGR01451 family)
VVTTYTVKILSGGGSSQSLNTLLYDFSGSSFHYNADFSTGARFANIIDPTTATIAKSFLPGTIAPGGTSTMTITFGNPNSGPITGVSVTDAFPSGMTVSSPLTFSTTCAGSPVITDAGGGALDVGDTGIRITGASIPSGNCTLKVKVTTTATPDPFTYVNTTQNLFVNGSTDTGKTAAANLTLNSSYFPLPTPPSSCPGSEVTLATWTFSGAYSASYAADSKQTNVSSATASASGTTGSFSGGRLYGTDGWTIATTVANADSPYVQFSLDTSNYGGVRIQYGHLISPNPGWGGSNNLYTFSSADGAAYSQIDLRSAAKGGTNGTLTTVGPFTAFSTGSGTTSFRVIPTGSATGRADEKIELDDVMVTGCARPATTPPPPRLTKAFSPVTIGAGATSTLTFTLTNTTADNTALSGVKFVDNLPAGVVVAATPSASTTCGGTPSWAPTTGSSTLNFGQTTGATMAVNNTCTVSVNVTAAAAGVYDNASEPVFATQSGSNTADTGIATATLTVVAPPAISKLFAPNPILAGGVSTLTFAITNPNQNIILSGVAFTDTFPIAPGAMVVAAAPNATTSGCGTPTFVPVAGAGSISFSNGTITGGGTCYVTVNITAPANGTYNSTSGNVSHIINAATVNGNTASASLTVNPASPQIELLKQVGPSAAGPWAKYMPVTIGANVYYKFTVENPGDVDLSSVTVNDPAFGGLVAGCSWGTLAKYGDATCAAGPIPAVSGSVLNTATASGTYSATVYTDQSSALYATTDLTFSKSATQTYFTAVGNVLNYSYLVTNSGFATLQGPVTVADNKTTVTCPALSTVGNLDNFFNAAEVITCTATYTVTAADVTAKLVTNIASATVGGATSSTASKTVPLAPPDFTAKKNNNTGGQVTAGGSFVWTLTVANGAAAGTALITDGQVLLQDDLPVSGATYVAGAVTKAGATGTITCAIASNVLTCTASGAVMIPPLLQGTVAVTNGSTDVTGTGTAFTTQLTAGSVISISNVSYTVASISSDTALTLTANCAGANASGLTVPGSFSVPITVMVTAPGGSSLVNPKSGGICRAEPGEVVVESDDTNNDCADTVTVVSLSGLTITKSVQVYSDPINGIDTAFGGSGSAKPIPGAEVIYTVVVTNTGAGAIDNNTVVIADILPADTILCVANACSNPPVTFSCSVTPACGTDL